MPPHEDHSRPSSFGRYSMKRSLFRLTAIALYLGIPGSPLPAAPAAPVTDPTAYCRAYGNVDEPGPLYAGAHAPRWIVHALDIEQMQPFAAEQLDWRCMDGRVYACFDYGASQPCGKASTSRVPTPAIYEECRANPNAAELPMAATGSLTAFVWGCRGRDPVIIRQFMRVDQRGYPVGLYKDVTAFAPGASAQPATVITTDGMLGITIGMTVRQIAHLIKQPGNYSQDMGVNTYECQVYDTRSDLEQVMVQRGVVTSIVTTSPRLATPAGARVGISEASLRRIYGPRLLRGGQNSYNERGADYYVHSSSGNGIRFGVADGQVRFIAAGRRSSIHLSEGCL